jgi:hypothetical protein
MPDMPNNEEYIYKTIDPLLGGLDTSKPGDEIDDHSSPNLLNVIAHREMLKVDTGYSTFGSTVVGYPMLSVQIFYKDGSTDLLLITTTRVYKWTNSEWQYVDGGSATELSASAAETDTVISVNDASSFTQGDEIFVALDNGGQHHTTVSSVSTNDITLNDAMPSAASVGNGVGEPVVLNGNLDSQVNFTQWVAGDVLIITNNSDNVKQYNGTSVTDVPNLPGSGSCKAVNCEVFNNYLLLINTTESGTNYPQRVRYSAAGDYTDWPAANYTDLYDGEDWLLCPVVMGPYLFIYAERSIYRCKYIGSASLIFDFELMIAGEGVVSSKGVADVGDYHIFFGNSNIYRYEGDYSIDPIADSLYYEIFGIDGLLNPAYKDRVFGMYIEELDEIWLFFASVNNEIPDVVIRYSLVHGGLYLREFHHSLLGFGFYETAVSRTWNKLSGSWLQQDWIWKSKRIVSSSPITLLLGYDPKQVYSYDYLTQGDDGNVVSWYADTKDFTSPSEMIRFDLLEFEAKGPEIKILYSTDGGSSYTTLETRTMGAAFTKHRIYKQFVADQARFRFEGSKGGFVLKRFKMKYKRESFW